jgi:predicted transposase YbfD/YdcC
MDAQEGDYLLALKDNPSHLHQDVAALFDRLHASSGTRQDWLGGAVGRAYTTCTEHDSGHGRQERRACRVLTLAAEDPDWADVPQEWAGLRSLVPLTRTRTQNGTTSVETVYYLARLPQDARRLEQALRRHWQIENCLHHVLDVGMNAHCLSDPAGSGSGDYGAVAQYRSEPDTQRHKPSNRGQGQAEISRLGQ